MYFIKICYMRNYTLLAVGMALLCCCTAGGGTADQSGVKEAVAFGNAFFNYDFEEALTRVTPESERWLRFAASNVTEQDVEVLNAQQEGAVVEAETVEYSDDSTLTVVLHVDNYLQKERVGQKGHIAYDGRYRVELVKRNGRYLVRMAGLPRNERRSRD